MNKLAKPLVGLIDLDGTITGYEKSLLDSLNTLRCPDEEVLTRIPFEDTPDYLQNRMHLIKSQVGWWKDLPVIYQGLKVIEAMRDVGFQLNVLTKTSSRIPNAAAEKIEWCRKHIPDAYPIIVDGREQKGLVYGHVFFDDHPPFMDSWLEHRPRGLGIMLANQYNEGYSNPQVIKYDGTNLKEVVEALCVVRNRQPGEDLCLNP